MTIIKRLTSCRLVLYCAQQSDTENWRGLIEIVQNHLLVKIIKTFLSVIKVSSLSELWFVLLK